MKLAGTTRTTRRPIGTALLAIGAFLIALATTGTASAQCTVTNCTTCVQDPICTQCTTGYALGSNTCFDVNECATNGGGCGVVAGTTCTNSPGTYACNCPSGYANAGGTATGTCTDVNECATANGGCFAGTTCTNTAGSRTCGTCPTGYTGDGITCNDLNECATNNGGCAGGGLATCTNTPGSRTCTCNAGYAGPGTVCNDVNECATGTACGPGTCSNGTGTFTCSCPTGVTGTTCDVNGYVPPDKDVGKCESAVASNVAKYVKCVLKCRQQKADKALAGKDFDEQACQSGPRGCRAAYDKKVADLIAKGDCPACLGDVAQGLLADDVRDSMTDVKGRTYCEGTVPLAP